MAKKTKIIIIVLVAFSIAGFFLYKNKDTKVTYLTEKVKRGQLIQTVEATGVVESANKISLNFKTTGRVSEVKVKLGDNVQTGQILASLEARALRSRIADAQASLQQAQANYDKVKAGASIQDVSVSENNLREKETALIASQNDLENLLSKKETELKSLKSTLLITLNNEIVIAEGSMETVNNILANSDAQETLGSSNPQYLIKALNSQEAANAATDSSRLAIFALETTNSDEQIITAADNLVSVLDQVKVSLQDTLNVLENTPTSYNLSETELDTFKSSIKAEQVKNNTSRINVNTSLSNFSNKKAVYEELVSSAEDAVNKAEKALAVAQSQLDLKKAPAREFDLRLYEAQIKQAQANLSLAQSNFEDTIIKAPSTGVITKINYKVGEQSSLAEPALEMISEANFEIKVDIPESDIAKVQVGQKADITLDAFGDERIFGGTVTFIEPAETNIQDVVYYKVTVQFKDKDQVKSGMTANLTIITASKEDVLIIPLRAIKQRADTKFVEVLENNLPAEKKVEVGLKGDSGIEIVSGVNENEEVIISEVKK